jgi:hypothetical protein
VASSPFRIRAYGKDFASLGLLGDPQAVTVYPRHNQQPTAQVVVRSDHQLAGKLLTEGCRLVIDYHGRQIVSGPVDQMSGDGSVNGALTLQVRDDWSLLTDVLGWPVPSAAISAQNTSAYDTRTGPAETVVKGFVQAAVTRLGLPVTVAPDLGRGQTITVSMRMHALLDRLMPLIDQASIGVTVRQNGTSGLVVDCYEPAWYPQTLSPHSGVVVDWEWSRSAPKATRAVVGGQGDGTARVFRQRIDTTAESLWGMKREVFVDASDAATSALLDARGDAAIAEGAATAGLKLMLAETDSFRYGDQLRVGDLVTTKLVPGADPITDVLREAVISWSADEGLSATPVVGDRTDDPDKTFARAVASLARAVRIDRARR